MATTLTMRMAREGESLLGAERQGLRADRRGRRHRRRGGGGGAGRHHRRRAVRLRRGDHRVSSSSARCSIRCASRCPAGGTTSAPMRGPRFERGIDPALMRPALEAATRMMLELCGGEASEVVGGRRRAGLAAQRHPALRAHGRARRRRCAAGRGGGHPASASASRVQARDAEPVTVAVPSWRNDVAAPIGAWTQDPALPADARARRRRGLRRGRAGMRPGGGGAAHPRPRRGAAGVAAGGVAGAAARADAEAGAGGAGAAGAGGARDAGMRHLRLPRGRDRGAVRRDAGGAAARQPDRGRPRPDAADPGRLAAAGGRAQRGARLRRTWRCARSAAAYRDPVAARASSLVAAGLRAGHDAAALGGAVARRGRAWTPRAMRWRCWRRSACRWRRCSVTADAPGFYHPGRSPACVRQGPKMVLAPFGEIHPRVLAALDLSGPGGGFEVFLDAVPEPKRRKKRRRPTCRPSSRCGATSPSWWMRACRPRRCCAPRAGPTGR